MSHIYVTVF